MSFGKAFATAFLNGLTGQIQKRSAEAVEERKRRERIAETAGLQQYLKRQKNFNKYLNIAKKIQKLGGDSEETKQNIAKLATNPELLLSANTYIDAFTQKFPNVKITPARINGFIANLDLVMPEKGMTLEEAARQSAGLTVQNTNLEEEKKDPNAMENNIFMSLLGVGAEQRELEKLKSKKVGQGFSTYDLYTMAMGGDYTPIDQATGSLDFSYFPKPFTVAESNQIDDVIQKDTLKALSREIAKFEQQLANTDSSQVQQRKYLAGEISKLQVQASNYADGIGRDALDPLYAAPGVASRILTTGRLSSYMQSQTVDSGVKRAALKILIDDPVAINRFGEEELQRQGALLGMNLQKTGTSASGQVSAGQTNVGQQQNQSQAQQQQGQQNAQQNAQANQQKQTRLNYVKSKPFVKNNQGETALDAFVREYSVSALPMNISEFKNVGSSDLKRPRVNQFDIDAWDKTWGKYYKPDGTRK